MLNESKLFINKLMKFSLSTWVSAVISIVSIPLITRVFDPVELGKFNMFIIGASLFSQFVIFAMDNSYLRFYHEPPDSRKSSDILIQCISYATILWALCSFVIILYKEPLSLFLFGDMNFMAIYFLCIYVCGFLILRFLNLTFRMRGDHFNYNLQAISIAIVQKLLFVLVIFLSPTYSNAIMLLSIALFCLALFYLLKQRRVFDWKNFKFSRQVSKEIMTYSIPLVPVNIMSWANIYISSIIVQKYLGFENLAIFSIAITLAAIMNLFQIGFNNYWSSYYLANYKSNQEFIKNISTYVSCLMIFVGILVIVFQDIIIMILGEKYREAALYFPFLLITPVLYTILETTSIGINLSKKTYLHTLATIISLLVNIVISLALVKFLGIIGVCIGSLASILVLFILKTYYGQKNYKSIENYGYLIINLIILMAMPIMNYVLYENILLKSCILIIITIFFIWFNKKIFKTIIDILYTFFKNKKYRRVQ